MRKEKGRRRGNKTVWTYMHSCLIQAIKEKGPVVQNIESIQNRQSV